MNGNVFHELSRRERQIMDVLYRFGEATAVDVRENIPDPPTYAAVRRLIAILEEKGYVTHRNEGAKYVYRTVDDLDDVRRSAIGHLTETFFRGSTFRAVAAMLDLASADLSEDELADLAKMIEAAKEEGR